MNTTRMVAQCLRALGRYKMRTGFMMLGCLVAVAALVFVVSVGTGAERKILQTVQRLFSSSSILVSAGGNVFAGGPRAEGSRMTLDDFEAVKTALPSVEVFDPMQVLDPIQVRRGDASCTTRVLGQSERAERVWERSVSQGEFFDASAVARMARVAVIGTTLRRELFAGEDPVGDEILIGSAPFRVIGVLEPMGTDAHGLDRDNEIVVPISTAMRRLANLDTIRGAKLLVRDPARVAETARELRRILRERHALAAGQADDFAVMTAADAQKLVAKAQRVFFVFLPLMAAISLLAGAVVAASLMLLSVSERVGEIGLRRAVGARPRDIAVQFLWETLLTTLLGGAGGVVVGGLASTIVVLRLGLQASISWKAVVLGLALSALTGLAAGVLPARRAALLQPADALR
jgi:putative ABC transport system permease protein